MIRHLLYSVYAKSHTDEWRSNVEQICKYGHHFNGRKIVIIRSDENTVSPEEVESAFTFPVEFSHVQNENLHETSRFIEHLAKFNRDDLGDDEILFYAHTKGVKYKLTDSRINFVRNWRDIMYVECLGDIDKIDQIMKENPCAGCFIMKRQVSHLAMPDSRWHFSGNYWWVHLKTLFSRSSWTFTYQHTHAVEAYLGYIFDFKEAYNIAYTTKDLHILHKQVPGIHRNSNHTRSRNIAARRAQIVEGSLRRKRVRGINWSRN